MDKLKVFWKQSWLLISSALLFGLLLAVAKAGLQPLINANEAKSLNSKMTELISDVNSFDIIAEGIEIASKKGKPLVTDVYQAKDKHGNIRGYAFVAIGSGFADKIKLVIAVDKEFKKMLGFKVLASNETPGFGDKVKGEFFQHQFINAPVSKLELVKVGNADTVDAKIVAISGATISSDAVISIFNTFVLSVKEQIHKKGLISNE